MWIGTRAILLTCVLAGGLAVIGSHPAGANRIEEVCDDLKKHPDPDHPFVLLCMLHEAFKPLELATDTEAARAVARPVASTQRMTNVGATLQPGEPTEGGKMTRTVWASFKAPAAERVVIHTYGSEPWDGTGAFDTVLAAYRGTEIGDLIRVAGNDNVPLAGIPNPGLTNRHSLIQFNTVKGTQYQVQAGSRSQAEGAISLNVFRFPPTGGLSAFLIYTARNTTNPVNGRDYICDFFAGPSVTTTCPDATFIVHNSTSNTLAVTASSTLGAGVTASPATFSLGAGALQVVTFKFGASFDRTMVRTLSGHFTLTGRRNDAVVSEARHRAVVVARSGTSVQDLISATAAPTVQTGNVNEALAFTVKVTNTGSQTAIGCHVRSKPEGDMRTVFAQINPSTGAQIGADDTPVDIPAGESRTFKVNVASQSPRDADYIDPEVIPDCANNQRTQWGLRSGFDISTSNDRRPLPSIAVTAAAPANVLSVPASGFAFYTFRATNRGSARTLTAVPAYERPFDDPLNTAFQVDICRTDLATGECIRPYAGSVTYTATANRAFGFSIRVRAPAGTPNYDPDKRRIYVNFKLADAPYFRIAAPNVAVRKQ